MNTDTRQREGLSDMYAALLTASQLPEFGRNGRRRCRGHSKADKRQFSATGRSSGPLLAHWLRSNLPMRGHRPKVSIVKEGEKVHE